MVGCCRLGSGDEIHDSGNSKPARCTRDDRVSPGPCELPMNTLVKKLTDIEREVAEERGGFALFALFEREDLFGKCDLVISAPWVDESKRSAIAYMVGKARAKLDPE